MLTSACLLFRFYINSYLSLTDPVCYCQAERRSEAINQSVRVSGRAAGMVIRFKNNWAASPGEWPALI